MGWVPADFDSDPLDPGYWPVDPAAVIDAYAALGRLMQRPAWHAQAACRGRGAGEWFPERGASTKAAQETCATCPVRAECRSYALDAGPQLDGIWAGTSRMTRRAMRRTVA